MLTNVSRKGNNSVSDSEVESSFKNGPFQKLLQLVQHPQPSLQRHLLPPSCQHRLCKVFLKFTYFFLKFTYFFFKFTVLGPFSKHNQQSADT